MVLVALKRDQARSLPAPVAGTGYGAIAPNLNGSAGGLKIHTGVGVRNGISLHIVIAIAAGTPAAGISSCHTKNVHTALNVPGHQVCIALDCLCPAQVLPRCNALVGCLRDVSCCAFFGHITANISARYRIHGHFAQSVISAVRAYRLGALAGRNRFGLQVWRVSATAAPGITACHIKNLYTALNIGRSQIAVTLNRLGSIQILAGCNALVTRSRRISRSTFFRHAASHISF